MSQPSDQECQTRQSSDCWSQDVAMRPQPTNRTKVKKLRGARRDLPMSHAALDSTCKPPSLHAEACCFVLAPEGMWTGRTSNP